VERLGTFPDTLGESGSEFLAVAGVAMWIDVPFVASMVSGVGIVQQTLQLATSANLPHFDLVPSLDRVWVPAAIFSVAEGEVAPVDTVSATGCGIQKNGVVWGVPRDQLDVLRGDARASFRGIGDIGGVDDAQS
jgi:hypothetical protein